jgi:site-specific recombinase
MMIVSRLDKYHLAPVTKLFPNPKINKNKMATKLVIQMKLLLITISFALATMVGMRGKNPKKQKLKKVTKLFRKGFYSSGIN